MAHAMLADAPDAIDIDGLDLDELLDGLLDADVVGAAMLDNMEDEVMAEPSVEELEFELMADVLLDELAILGKAAHTIGEAAAAPCAPKRGRGGYRWGIPGGKRNGERVGLHSSYNTVSN